MKISMNNVGNYTPRLRTGNDLGKKFNIDSATVPANNTPAVKAQSAENTAGTVTSEEKKYFMDMYPENKSEIMDYHFYQKSGKMSGVKVGSLIDRRG
jgi:hypothetical protein